MASDFILNSNDEKVVEALITAPSDEREDIADAAEFLTEGMLNEDISQLIYALISISEDRRDIAIYTIKEIIADISANNIGPVFAVNMFKKLPDDEIWDYIEALFMVSNTFPTLLNTASVELFRAKRESRLRRAKTIVNEAHACVRRCSHRICGGAKDRCDKEGIEKWFAAGWKEPQ